MNELQKFENLEFTKTGLRFLTGPTFEQWESIGEMLKKMNSGVQFWIGDWLNYGENEWGDKYTQALDITDYELGTLQNYAYVSKNVESSRRSENLSFGHHQNVANLEPDKQEKWLKIAKDEGWSVYQMRRKIESDKRYGNSDAEEDFSNFMLKKYPKLSVSKKGMPDFMILEEDKIIGFVEVKRTDLSDGLRKEQKIFRDFCMENEIPYQVWSPIMKGDRWEFSNKNFKNAMLEGTKEIV